jgi:hypothetical protein
MVIILIQQYTVLSRQHIYIEILRKMQDLFTGSDFGSFNDLRFPKGLK